MNREKYIHLASYVIVSVVAVGLAFLVSMRVLTRTHAQAPDQTAVGEQGKPPGPPVPPEESASSMAVEVQGFLEPFIYDSKNRRDPFRAYQEFIPIVETPGGTGPGGQPLNVPAIQKYELEEYKLIGIMWDVHQPRAMILDPDKNVHVLGRDESIGKRNGYIATIREGEMVVVESSRKDGEVQFRPKVMRIER